MDHISAHFEGPEPDNKKPRKSDTAKAKKDRATERGEMMQFFLEKLNRSRIADGLPPMTMGRIARLLMATPTNDLYYLRSVCEQASNFSKKFWWEINPKNHTPEKQKEREAFYTKQRAQGWRPTQYAPQLPPPMHRAKRALPQDPRSRD